MTTSHNDPMRSATRDLILTGLVCALGAVGLVILSVHDLMSSHGRNDGVVECVVDDHGTITGPKECSATIVILRAP